VMLGVYSLWDKVMSEISWSNFIRTVRWKFSMARILWTILWFSLMIVS
jgi:hypothetical protein